MTIQDFANKISSQTNISFRAVENTINLLENGATIPFIARYRKEITGGLDEVQITQIRNLLIQFQELEKRRKTIIDSITEQGLLTKELESKILSVQIMTELEDLYLPYKPKRKTKATIAIAKGLEPLARVIFEEKNTDIDIFAEKFIDSEKGVENIESALSGARDIIAEWINENALSRERMRNYFKRNAFMSSKVSKGKEQEGEKYENWFDWSEQATKAPSHRILALLRGEEEGFLKVKFLPEAEEEAIEILEKQYIHTRGRIAEELELACKDSYKRLLSNSMETEIRSLLKDKADDEAIHVFAENLRQLLMASPLGQKRVLALDPGYRTGCKLVCLDAQGQLLHNQTIYPHSSVREENEAILILENLVKAYNIEAIAIGNGTAGRETEFVVKKCNFYSSPIITLVNESGASVYSASEVAREEFGDYDLTVRGSVSIGRRLIDPLSELVKIDPKSIGVGQYQHDVNQNKLQKSLEETVISCVNQVGVDLNTASKELLTYVSGVGPVLAKNIVEYRNENGAFKTRKELLKVKRFGDKVFEQAAGFLRIREGKNPLDASAVHPERYDLVDKMAKSVGCTITELIHDREKRSQINIKEFITPDCGLPTLQDIMKELEKPGRDVRTKFEVFEFNKDVNNINDVHEGMILPGIVTNITAFGAFVDIGAHQDGLVHISHLANKFIYDPNDIVKINQKVTVKVIGVDIQKKRISLSMKEVN
ncbi:MAG: transcriptional accessory protein [Bacteroidetes bacterium]|nr:transcriptional accessory protein [Bacteroidota bacterium]